MTSVTICDVGPRDGLQNQPAALEPAVRTELVDRLAMTGVPRIEAVSFVNPERVPQMAGAEEVVAAVERRAGVVLACLTLNERGFGGCRSRRARRATSPPRTSCTSSTARASRSGIDLDALIDLATWLESVLGRRELEGQVYKAGTFAPVAGGGA
jgi:hypothetical protein